MNKQFKPIHPAFVGSGTVTPKNSKHTYRVDLTQGVCSCPVGQPFYDYEGKQVANAYCSHKLKLMAMRVKKDYENLIWPYVQAVATRYNVFEVVSAFHKELRRGDFEQAYYWACMLIRFRGKLGVIKYMINIIYEETRDHGLLEKLLNTYEQHSVEMQDIANCVYLFCNSKKKWELPHRFAIFEAEMMGYKRLAILYGYDVAKAHSIIPEKEYVSLKMTLLNGYAMGKMDIVQEGLKGLFKSKNKSGDHEKQKLEILKLLDNIQVNKFKVSTKAYARYKELLARRVDVIGGYGYHELNAYADILCGEKWNDGLQYTYDKNVKIPLFNLSEPTKPIPMYAHDNHTWGGKQRMKKYSEQLEAGANQTNIDFRWCGAYFGVAWRHLAYKQFKTLKNVKWGDVKWPDWLYKHVRQMFY